MIEIDPRIEQTNGRKNSIFSAIKWNDNRFDELVKEGKNVLTQKVESELCNVIHLPDNSSNISSEVKSDDGMRHLKINAQNDSELHQLILNYSTKLFDNITKKGKNGSSMITPITLMTNTNNFDANQADKESIQYIKKNNCILLETYAISDTGAEVSVCDNEIRKVVGEERLTDATSNLMRATGTSENRKRNKLKLVKENG